MGSPRDNMRPYRGPRDNMSDKPKGGPKGSPKGNMRPASKATKPSRGRSTASPRGNMSDSPSKPRRGSPRGNMADNPTRRTVSGGSPQTNMRPFAPTRFGSGPGGNMLEDPQWAGPQDNMLPLAAALLREAAETGPAGQSNREGAAGFDGRVTSPRALKQAVNEKVWADAVARQQPRVADRAVEWSPRKRARSNADKWFALAAETAKSKGNRQAWTRPEDARRFLEIVAAQEAEHRRRAG